jgi:hypothetical protein
LWRWPSPAFPTPTSIALPIIASPSQRKLTSQREWALSSIELHPSAQYWSLLFHTFTWALFSDSQTSPINIQEPESETIGEEGDSAVCCSLRTTELVQWSSILTTIWIMQSILKIVNFNTPLLGIMINYSGIDLNIKCYLKLSKWFQCDMAVETTRAS